MARIARMMGALNGAMTPTTPTGRRRSIDSRGWVDRRSLP